MDCCSRINHGFHVARHVVRTTVDVQRECGDPLVISRNALNMTVHMTRTMFRFCNHTHGCQHWSCSFDHFTVRTPCLQWCVECGVWSVECGVCRVSRCSVVWCVVCRGAVWSVECGVWSVECGVWSVECGVWSVECGVWSVECGVWCGVRSAECGVRSAECGVRSVRSVECGV